MRFPGSQKKIETISGPTHKWQVCAKCDWVNYIIRNRMPYPGKNRKDCLGCGNENVKGGPGTFEWVTGFFNKIITKGIIFNKVKMEFTSQK